MNAAKPFRNLVLCGFMGSGKSTLGINLAAPLGMRFVDLDDRIVQRAGMPIPEIFHTRGESAFRDLEHDCFRDLLAEEGNIVATGGGCLTFERNFGPIKSSDLVVLLNPGFEDCWQRIRRSDRPMIQGKSRAQVKALFDERMTQYRRIAKLELSTRGSKRRSVDAALKLLGRGQYEGALRKP